MSRCGSGIWGGPHIDQGVFTGIRVVAASAPGKGKAEFFIQATRGRIAGADFKNGFAYAAFFRLPQGPAEQIGPVPAPPPVGPHRDVEDFQFIRGVVYGKVGDKFASFVDAADGKGRVLKCLTELFFSPGQGEATAFQICDGRRVARVKTAGDRRIICRKGRGRIMHVGSLHAASVVAPSRGRRACARSVPAARAGGTPDELVEFFDERDRLLLVAPAGEAARLGLRRAVVGVALRLAGGRLLVRRRGAGREARLDLSGVARVRPGEACEDAALRALGRAPDDPVRLLRAASAFLSAPGLRVVLILAGPYAGPPPEDGANTLALDRDELEGVARADPDLLTPALLWSVRSGRLWPTGR